MASTVSGSSPVVARRRRRGSAPPGRRRCRRRARRCESTGLVAGAVPEHRAHQPLGALCGSRRSRSSTGVALRPRAGEEVVHLGPRQRQHHEGRVAPGAAARRRRSSRVGRSPQCRSSSTSSTGRRGALGREQVLAGAAHLVAHELRVAAARRGAATLAPSKGRARRRARRGTRPRACASRAGRRAPRGRELRAAAARAARRRSTPAARRMARGEHAEGRAGAHRVAAPDPHLDAVAARAQPAHQLVRRRDSCPCPRGAVDQRHALAIGSATHVGEERLERASSRSRPTQGVGRPSSVRVPPSRSRSPARRAPVARDADVEAPVEQAGGHLVERTRPPARRRRSRSTARAIDDLAHRGPPVPLARGRRPPRRPPPGGRRWTREGAAGRARGAIGRGAGAPKRDQPASRRRGASASPPCGAIDRRAAPASCHVRGVVRAPRRIEHADHPPLAAVRQRRRVARRARGAAPRGGRARRARRAPRRRRRGRAAGALGEHARRRARRARPGTSARSSATRGGSSRTHLGSTRDESSPVKAPRPGEAAKSTQPSENTSARASTSLSPRACSGAMYPGVPIIAPVAGDARPRAGGAGPRRSR